MNFIKSYFTRFIPWLIWGLGAGAFFIEYIIRVAPAAMVPDLMQTFKASSLTISSFAAFFLYAYVGMQIPVGILVDRFSARVCLFLSTILCALSTWVFASTHHLYLAQGSRIFFGLGASFALISTLKLAMIWFKPQYFSILVGVSQSLGMIGGAAGVSLMGRLVVFYGWQDSMIMLAILLAILAILILFIVRNPVDGKRYFQAKEPVNSWTGLKIVFHNPQTWLISLYAGLLFMPTAVFAELWGSFYLSHVHAITTLEANDGISLIFLGWAIGAPLSGFLANRMGRRFVMIISALSSLILMPCILYIPSHSLFLIYVLLFLFGFSNTGIVAAYTAIAEINPKKVAGIALAVGNGMSVLVGAFCQQFVGMTIDFYRQQRIFLGVNDYSANELKIAMLIIVLGSCFTLLLSFFTKETLKKTSL